MQVCVKLPLLNGVYSRCVSIETLSENCESKVWSSKCSEIIFEAITDTVCVGKGTIANSCINFTVTWMGVTEESFAEYPDVCGVLHPEKRAGLCHARPHPTEALRLTLESLHDFFHIRPSWKAGQKKLLNPSQQPARFTSIILQKYMPSRLSSSLSNYSESKFSYSLK